MPATDMTQKNS